ncbi:YcxB family protein [Rhizobium tropici]|uniref:YcxB family protein n=1 Tax=Rhizobium tropici TaxID=398 RepID=A0A5B0VYI5_RHITR|nr:YcxB family protein [Rhizobium tropici]KAA1179444.1 YcxB family protein [Rhizobium tropici]
MSELRQDDQQRTELVYELTPQDLLLALRLHFRQHIRSRSAIIRLVMLWALAVVACGLILASAVDTSDAIIPILTFSVALPIGIVGIPFLTVYTFGGRAARKTYREQKTLHKPVHLSWSEDGVHFSSDFGEARLQWSDFLMARQDRHCILLYESRRLYRLIPKRILAADQVRELQVLARKVQDHSGF